MLLPSRLERKRRQTEDGSPGPLVNLEFGGHGVMAHRNVGAEDGAGDVWSVDLPHDACAVSGADVP